MSIPSFIKGQIFTTPPLVTTSFQKKTIIITGANVGLGFECAKHLLNLRVSTLVLAVRSLAKGEAAAQRLRDELQQKEGSQGYHPAILVRQLDLSSYASVLAFADRCEQELEQVDGLMLNAGIFTRDFELVEGNEKTLTVNLISNILLALLLLPKMRETASRVAGSQPHISVVSSIVHAFAKTKDLTSPAEGQIFATLNDEQKAKMDDRYNLSKLLVLLCLRELASRIEKENGKPLVVVNNPAPGWCKTELFRDDYAGWTVPQKMAFRMMGREAEEGARTLVHGMVAGRKSHGQYLSECIVKDPSAFVKSKEGARVQEKVWFEVAAKLEDIRPGLASAYTGVASISTGAKAQAQRC